MEKKITQLQGFNAVSMLFDIYYVETLSDDLGGILGSMSFLSDGSTADQAMWEVWVEFLDKILEDKSLPILQISSGNIIFQNVNFSFLRWQKFIHSLSLFDGIIPP